MSTSVSGPGSITRVSIGVLFQRPGRGSRPRQAACPIKALIYAVGHDVP